MKRVALFTSVIVLFLLAEAYLFYPDYESPRIVRFLVISQLMFGLSLLIYYISRRFDFEGEQKNIFWMTIGFAIAARLIMLFGAGDQFYLSDDIYRYLWDGRVSLAGINPYLHIPTAPELTELRDSLVYPNINHSYLPTIYPPMAQNIFLLSSWVDSAGFLGFKIICAIFELLTLFGLFYLLREYGQSRRHLLLYLFSPLILIEFYLSAHLDILAMPFLIVGLIALHRDKPTLTGIAFALASLVKFYGLFFIPLIFLHLKPTQRVRFASATVITIVLLYLPYLFGNEGKFLGSLGDYLQEWQFNASIFFLLKYILALESARLIVAGLFLMWLCWLMIRSGDIRWKLFAIFAGYLVLTPTFFPWYFVWLFPLLLLYRHPPFIYLSGSILLSYHVLIGQYSTGTWSPMIWLGLITYLPFFGLLIWTALRTKAIEVITEK
ncbi:MAG: glycosyltransferase 87 family protein [candidate division Zixibacteria bacterium]